MIKKEFAERLAEKLGETKKRGAEITDAFLETLMEETKKDGVMFTGMFSTEVIDTPERIGRNPKTGEEVLIEKSKRIKFKVGKKFKDYVKGE